MRLADAFTVLGLPVPAGLDPTLTLTGLTADSRAVAPGMLFAALVGQKGDGRSYIPQALAAGACAVLALPDTQVPKGTVLIGVGEPRRALALLAAAFYGPTPQPLVAVTGTNGKTSTVTFAAALWRHLGQAGAASLGTLGVHGAGFDRPGSLTTPDPVVLHRILAELAQAGAGPVAMEASSHGLEQDRLAGVRLAAGAITNITRDHLDHHGTMEAYRAAKFRLFIDVLPEGAAAVINADIPEAGTLVAMARARSLRLLRYGRIGEELRLVSTTPLPHGQRVTLDILGERIEVELPLAGLFQVYNALAALGLVLGAASKAEASYLERAVEGLAHLPGVPGRLEKVAQRRNGATVYVDYAHTPDALETVLQALRPHCAERLVCVFGCGGDRDPGKRPLMGALAAQLADAVVVTDDNPRSEDPASIRAQILAACPQAQEIGDRGRAICESVARLAAGDVLVIAGKGHETGQTIGSVTHPFNDAEHARDAVRKEDA
ncbi:UDP-N-acetylmuramoyl-L-alanyl-D-glutamate--2,6-diaminopimelate ligase [Pararhodospirillum photometricum]|uniref:UDP-N-acetylmuramoyl-L-alanyl-D-glutamate--2, 6-diaminopimelate ligase n=1 Tax=Pararhodospirillum photometricum TaxID=1084 RepID=UPI0002E5B198|nr:UDP-N-acetylmuramoyl-L-alanyl-D-glutamate--2,6-diaminopimelate ligase [Pararhodospirillum photometricum]